MTLDGARLPLSRRTVLGAVAGSALATGLPLGGARAFAQSTPVAEATPGADSTEYTINGYGVTDADYARFGVAREIEPRADGWQTKAIAADPDTYEWWYYDIQTPDGVTIAGTLASTPTKGFVPRFGEPMASALISYSTGGPTRNEEVIFPLDQFQAAEDRLDVQAGPLSLTGDYQTNHLKGEINGLAVDLTFEQLATPFRVGSGYYLVGGPDRFRGWINAFPKARVTGTITVDGDVQQIDAVGYRDHNYGNITSGEGTVGWLWARADFERYVALAVRDQVRERFGGEQNGILWIYDLQEGKELVRSFGTDNPNLTVTEGVILPHPDPLHGGGYPTLTVYDYWNGDDRARLILRDTGVLAGFFPYNIADVAIQQFLRENDSNGAYYTRRTSNVSLDLDIGSQGLTDQAEGPALHELMESYFPQYIQTK